jgi:hypothetical protein
MDRKRRLALIFATVGIALGAGHIVQEGSAGTPRIATAALTPTAATPVSAQPEKAAPVVQAQAPLIVATPEPEAAAVVLAEKPLAVAAPEQEATAIATPADKPMIAVAPAPKATPAPVVLAALTDPVATTPTPATAPVAEACPITLDLVPEANAMIGIVLAAPCAPDTRVVLRHAGLAITAKTSMTGSLFMSLPALDARGEVSATLRGEPAVENAVAIPDLAGLRRFGVQWQDADAFQLHAFENGAAFGAPGHVSAAAAQMPKAGDTANAGFMTVLGETKVSLPMLAEVYTFPATGTLEIVVEAAITAKTCGRELLGETLTSTGGTVVTMDVTLATPDCTAIGDILVLNNLVADLTMASAN